MIRINLAPIDELENPRWFFPELIVFVLAASGLWYSVDTYFGGLKSQIQRIETEISNKKSSLSLISQETQRYSDLDQNIGLLNDQLVALRKITVSPIERFRPVILIEHLQSLKPEGVWFNYISENSDLSTITIVGRAFDSILFAEFISALNATKEQVGDPSDLRTQIYFETTQLERVSASSAHISNPLPQPIPAHADDGTRNFRVSSLVTDPGAVAEWGNTDHLFPEMAGFPSFQLTVRYRQRMIQRGDTGALTLSKKG